jgi:putative ATPase
MASPVQDYVYPHSHAGHWIPQQYLPDRVLGTIFYEPSDQGYEARVAERVKLWRDAQAKALNDIKKEK